MVIKSLYNFAKNQDMFGHKVVLNFNRKGETFKTGVGGFTSIIIKILISYIIYGKMTKLFNHELNQINKNEQSININDIKKKNRLKK